LVGSIEYEIGIPQTIGLRVILERVKDEIILITFNARLMVKYLRRFISNFSQFLIVKITIAYV